PEAMDPRANRRGPALRGVLRVTRRHAPVRPDPPQGQVEAVTVPIIVYNGTNHRGEPTSPRVVLIELRQLLDRAAAMVEGQALQLRAALGVRDIDPEARALHRDLIQALRSCRAVRVRRKRRTRIIAER